MTKQKTRGLAVARRFLKYLLPAEDVAYMEGYFEEMYETVRSDKGTVLAKWWLLAQIVRSVPGFLSHRLYWSFTMMRNYLVITVRNILKYKGFSLIKVFGLAAGIACGLVIILYVTNELTYDAYHPQADRLYRVAARRISLTGEHWFASTPGPLAYTVRQEIPLAERVTRFVRPYENADHVLVANGERRFFENRIWFAEPEAFTMFRIPFLRGNPRTALDAPGSVVITEGMAQKYFGTLLAVGKTLKIELDYDTGTSIAEDFRVTGVIENAPANTHLKYDMLVSFATLLAHRPNLNRDWIDFHHKYTYVKLAKDADPLEFETRLKPIADQFKSAYDKRTNRTLKLYQLFLQPVRSIHMNSNYLGEIEAPGSMYYIYIYAITALLILLIGCMNFINLSATLATIRTREVGIRKVVGARRRDLAYQFFGESYLITLLAFVLALPLTSTLLMHFNRLAGTVLSLQDLGQTAVLTLLGVLFILVGGSAAAYPVLVMSAYKPVSMLRKQITPGKSGSTAQRLLVVGQFAISIFLVICTLIVFRQLRYMKGKSLGFDRQQKVILKIKSNQAYFRRNYEAIKKDFLRHPAITQASVSSSVPGEEFNGGYYLVKTDFNGAEKPKRCKILTVDYDFISQYGIGIKAGRRFLKERPGDSEGAFLVNESGARELGYANPETIIGAAFKAHYHRKTKRVVGVTADFHFMGMKMASEPVIMDIEASLLRVLTLTVNMETISRTLGFIQETWENHFPDAPFEYAFLDETFDRVYRYEEQMGELLGIITTLGITVACLGLFGLVAFFTQLRKREIGIRKALGASASHIVFMMTRQFISLVVLASAMAIPAAWYAMHLWLQDFAYRIDPGFLVFAIALFTALIIASATIFFQGYRAATHNPVNVLRYE